MPVSPMVPLVLPLLPPRLPLLLPLLLLPLPLLLLLLLPLPLLPLLLPLRDLDDHTATIEHNQSRQRGPVWSGAQKRRRVSLGCAALSIISWLTFSRRGKLVPSRLD